ncbi:hypothetical protein BC829DRAFT_389464 [Chytridium lagenaria]|nr:hypothetical protein BC829DRAFT_389464 [Chytridium lagenaria]
MPLYASRLKHGNGLHPGMATSTTITIPYGSKGIHPTSTTTYDILTPIPNAAFLTHLTGDGGIHPNALIAGYESDGRPLYVARASVQRGMLDGRKALYPGKTGAHIGGAVVVVGGRELKVVPFDVLVVGGGLTEVMDRRGEEVTSTVSSSSASSMVEGDWVTMTGNNIPGNAWHVGADLDGDPLYVARAFVGGVLEVGKVGPNLEAAMFAVAGKEVKVRREVEVEVLVKPVGAKWVEVEEGKEWPEDAFGVGFDEEGRVIYVGRGKIQRSLLDRRTTLAPGKAAPHFKGCIIPFDNRQVVLTRFELLVVPKNTVIHHEREEDAGVSSDVLNVTGSSALELTWDDV